MLDDILVDTSRIVLGLAGRNGKNKSFPKPLILCSTHFGGIGLSSLLRDYKYPNLSPNIHSREPSMTIPTSPPSPPLCLNNSSELMATFLSPSMPVANTFTLSHYPCASSPLRTKPLSLCIAPSFPVCFISTSAILCANNYPKCFLKPLLLIHLTPPPHNSLSSLHPSGTLE